MNYKRIIAFVVCFIIVLGLSTLIYFCYIRTYKNNYFVVNYNIDWKKEKGKNFKIKNENDSTIEIYGQYDKDNNDVKDVYLDLNSDFLKNNKEYKLINSCNVLIGEGYYDGYELLYESENKQVLYVIVVKDNKIININYTSSNDNFDLDLEQFYDVVNTLKIGGNV